MNLFPSENRIAAKSVDLSNRFAALEYYVSVLEEACHNLSKIGIPEYDKYRIDVREQIDRRMSLLAEINKNIGRANLNWFDRIRIWRDLRNLHGEGRELQKIVSRFSPFKRDYQGF